MTKIGQSTVAAAAQNTFSGWMSLNKGTASLSMDFTTGTFVGTATLQRRLGTAGTTQDVEAWTAEAQKVIDVADEEHQYRIGVKTGEYTSGTLNAFIVQ